MAESVEAALNKYVPMRRGTAAQRAGTTSVYWQQWIDTDGDQKLWVGDRSGGWRQMTGVKHIPAGPWSTNLPDQLLAGRTVAFNIGSQIEPGEDLMISALAVGTGFGFVSLVGVGNFPGSATVTIRHMQIGAVTENGIAVAWQIIRSNS